MKRIFSNLALIAISLCSWQYAEAQIDTVHGTIVSKTKNAVLMTLEGANVGKVYGMSPNGKYITGQYGLGDQGWIYDVEKDSTVRIGYRGSDISDNGLALVVEVLGEEESPYVRGYMTAGTLENGVYKRLPVNPALADASDPGAWLVYPHCISADGRIIGASSQDTCMTINPATGKLATYSLTHGFIYKDRILLDERLTAGFPFKPSEFGGGVGGYKARMYNCSPDGSVFVGFTYRPEPDYVDRVPAIWRLQPDGSYKLYNLGLETMELGGEIRNVANDGKYATGRLENQPAFWTYNEESDTYDLQQFSPAPGYTGGDIGKVTDNGDFGFALQFMGDVLSRTAHIWSKDNGFTDMNLYMKEVYGIADFYYDTPMDMSTDGTVLSGYRMYQTPWVLKITGAPNHTRPMNVTARQIDGTNNVRIIWDAPIKVGYNLLSYNIYCDSIKINPMPVTETSYIQELTAPGYHTYTVTAVYEDDVESIFSTGAKIQVVEPGGCYSVKNIESMLTYNRYAETFWDIPNSEIGNGFPTYNAGAMKPYELSVYKTLKSNDGLDIVTFPFGKYLYMGNFSGTFLNRFDSNGNFDKKIFLESGIPAVICATEAQGELYVGGGDKSIVKIDPDQGKRTGYMPIDIEAWHLSYIPTLDGGNGGFAVGDDKECIFINMRGKKIESEGSIPLELATGSAYHDGKLYFSQQSGPYENEIIEYDLNTKQITRRFEEYSRQARLLGLSEDQTCLAGGLSVMTMPDGAVCLISMVQYGSEYDKNYAAFLELKSPDRLVGYNVKKCKDGIVDTAFFTTARGIVENIATAGKYAYIVQAVFHTPGEADSCKSEWSDTARFQIYDKDVCNAVIDLKGEEINRQIFLEWERPEESDDLIGFNIFRDGEALNTQLYSFFKYIDKEVADGSYEYVVQAFYANGCIADDTVTVIKHGLGNMQPVLIWNITATRENGSDETQITANWNLPPFESPYPLTYASGATWQGTGFVGGAPVSAGIGWDSTVLNMYEGFKVVGVEVFLYDEADLAGFVLVNEKVVYDKPADQRFATKQYNRILFDTPIGFDHATELIVGVTATNYNGETGRPIGLDINAAQYGYSDLLTDDIYNVDRWTSSMTGYTWAINALIAKERDIEQAKADGSYAGGEFRGIIALAGNRTQEPALPLQQVKMPKSNDIIRSVTAPKLVGFNLYRDKTKLNESPLKTLSYTDKVTETEGLLTYELATVWNDGEEVFSTERYIMLEDVANRPGEAVLSGIRVYPNPASEILHIEGDFEKAALFSLSGNRLKDIPTGSRTLSVSSLQSGVYFMSFFKENRVKTIKLVIR